MAQEVAVNVPFDVSEIKEIAVDEFRKRLDQLSPIQGMKEYARFSLDFQVKIKLWRTGEQIIPKETLAWGNASKDDPSAADLDVVEEEAEIASSTFTAKDPNTERIDRDMPLTLETRDGRGNLVRRKGRIKG